MLCEHIYLSGDADQTDLILRLVVDQKRRVDVEEELRQRTEVVPVTVVDSSSPGRWRRRFIATAILQDHSAKELKRNDTVGSALVKEWNIGYTEHDCQYDAYLRNSNRR